MSKQDKLNAAKKAMREINKQHKDVVIDFASNQSEWEKLSTGIESFDEFLGGGWVRGHFNVLWGGEAVGKSTLMYHTIAKAQEDGLIVAYLDEEHSFEPVRARQFGVNLNDLIVGHHEIAEQALDTIIKLAKEKVVDVIILDSIHSLSPKGEKEDKKGSKSVEKDTMALVARKLAQFFRMATNDIYKSNIAVILIGQTRTNLGGFIALQTLSGGSALKHYSILTVNARRGAKADAPQAKYVEYFLDPDGKLHKRTKTDEAVGFDAVFKLNKTQSPNTAPEQSTIHAPFYFADGFLGEVSEELPIRIEGTKEEQEKIRELIAEKTVKQPLKEKPKKFQEEVKEEIEKPKKKKRGRPKKNENK